MWFLVFMFWLLVVSVLQTTLGEWISVSQVVPDLFLIFSIYCGVHLLGNSGIWMGMFAGLVQDCLSGGMLGINTLSKSLTAYFFTVLRNKIMVEGLFSVVFFTLFASVFDALVFYAVWTMLLKGGPSWYLFPPFIVYVGYNAAVSPVLFWILNKSRKWTVEQFPTTVLKPL